MFHVERSKAPAGPESGHDDTPWARSSRETPRDGGASRGTLASGRARRPRYVSRGTVRRSEAGGRIGRGHLAKRLATGGLAEEPWSAQGQAPPVRFTWNSPSLRGRGPNRARSSRETPRDGGASRGTRPRQSPASRGRFTVERSVAPRPGGNRVTTTLPGRGRRAKRLATGVSRGTLARQSQASRGRFTWDGPQYRGCQPNLDVVPAAREGSRAGRANCRDQRAGRGVPGRRRAGPETCGLCEGESVSRGTVRCPLVAAESGDLIVREVVSRAPRKRSCCPSKPSDADCREGNIGRTPDRVCGQCVSGGRRSPGGDRHAAP
jgi:hypothetical protein